MSGRTSRPSVKHPHTPLETSNPCSNFFFPASFGRDILYADNHFRHAILRVQCSPNLLLYRFLVRLPIAIHPSLPHLAPPTQLSKIVHFGTLPVPYSTAHSSLPPSLPPSHLFPLARPCFCLMARTSPMYHHNLPVLFMFVSASVGD